MVEDEEKKPEQSPADYVRRWIKEIEIAVESERAWKEEATRVWKIYEGGDPRKDRVETDMAFNILWSNTETLLPAIYNSPPQPDVRRRFRDDDPLGKACSTVLERALSYAIDTEQFYSTLEDDVLDVLIPGRGLSRIKYEPTIVPQTDEMGQPIMEQGVEGEEPQPMTQKVDEKSFIEHVQWDDFIRGPGKRWPDLPWIGFRHRLTKEALVKIVGHEMAERVPMNYPNETAQMKDDAVKMAFGTAEVWEIWDKEAMEVCFISMGYADAPLRREPDPMEIDGFWPVPKPMYAIKNSRSLVPKPIYHMYESQAIELERVSRRINGVVRVCKLRGVYDSTMSEVGKLLEADDTDMMAIENASKYYTMGGLDKAIWMMPVDGIAVVLAQLYQARDQAKQTIYELTGISDVIRGATNASETATAQSIKSQWGGIRLKNIQREVQRYGRDIMRMLGDVICSKYDWQTLAQITGLEYPTAQEKQQAQMMLQQQQSIPPQIDPMTGQPMPPPPPDPMMQKAASSPSWEEIMEVLRNDRQRCYKVDIETDSTIQETLDTDMQGLQQVLGALVQFIGSAMPLVQQGVMTIDGIKSVVLQIVRRAKMGSAVEDAIESMQAPPPPQPQMPTQDPSAGMQDAVKQIMEALNKPRKIVAQADMSGKIEGEVSQ